MWCPGKTGWFGAFRVSADARAQHDDPGQRRPPAQTVDDGGPEKSFIPALREKAAAPDPVSRDRVDDRGENQREHQERACTSCAR